MNDLDSCRAVFRVSVREGEAGYAGFATETMNFSKDNYLTIRQLGSAGPHENEAEVLAALIPLARMHGYTSAQTVITRD